MIRNEHIDQGKSFDWGRTSRDYRAFRPGYPGEFYRILRTLGLGLPGQRILDLATGTGELALNFARAGAAVTGIDISPEQIRQARETAAEEGLSADFQVSPAEEVRFADNSFDAVTASMCWIYFDKDRLLPVLKRILKDRGFLLLAAMIWLPGEDETAGWTEDLILQYNPGWTGAGFGDDPFAVPPWAARDYALKGFYKFKEDIPFSHQSWRGRIRACRGIGASLPDESVRAFDKDLEEALRQRTPDPFRVRHLITIQIYELRKES